MLDRYILISLSFSFQVSNVCSIRAHRLAGGKGSALLNRYLHERLRLLEDSQRII